MEHLIACAIYEIIRDGKKLENLEALKQECADRLGTDAWNVRCFDKLVLDIPWSVLLRIVSER